MQILKCFEKLSNQNLRVMRISESSPVQIMKDPKQLEIVLPMYLFVLLGPVYCSAFILLCLILHCTISSSENNVVASKLPVCLQHMLPPVLTTGI